MTPAASTPAVIYCRVSTREQGVSGLGLESQEARCREECERRGWQVARVVREVVSGDTAKRPLFDEACEAARELSGVLVGASIDRIARGGPLTVLPLYQRAADEGWAVYALDMPEIDTTSPMGEFVLTILAAVGRMERRMIAHRTSNAMNVKVARGEPVGRPRIIDREEKDPEGAARARASLRRLRALRRSGLSYDRIVETLNAEGTPSLAGDRWHKRSVYLTCRRYGIGVER